MKRKCRTTAAVLGAQARRRLTAPGLAGAQGPWIMCSPHTGSFHLYITGECEALPFSTKSSHFATALPLLLNPSLLSQNVPQKGTLRVLNVRTFPATSLAGGIATFLASGISMAGSCDSDGRFHSGPRRDKCPDVAEQLLGIVGQLLLLGVFAQLTKQYRLFRTLQTSNVLN